MDLTKKEVKILKKQLVAGILRQMSTEVGDGYKLVLWDCDTQQRELLVVDRETRYIPDNWHAGITNGVFYKFGDTLTRVGFASEEAKRMVRDMFPEQARFVTWAWYN